MSTDTKPAGYETKTSVPGCVPAMVPTSDHPGPYFEGRDGYSNTPGIGDPEASSAPSDSSEGDSGTTMSKTGGKSTKSGSGKP